MARGSKRNGVSSKKRFSTIQVNPVASRLPIRPAAVPSSKNSAENMAAMRLRVAPSVLKTAISRTLRNRVPATLDARMMAPAKIAKPEMKRMRSAT